MLQIQSTQPFYTYEEIAALCGKTPKTLLNIISSKKPKDNNRKAMLPPFRRLAGSLVVSATDLISWLQQQPVVAGAIEAPACNSKGGRPRKTPTNYNTK